MVGVELLPEAGAVLCALTEVSSKAEVATAAKSRGDKQRDKEWG